MRTLFITVALVAFACASSQYTSVQVPADLVIRYTEGGGFTGEWTGAIIQPDGSVYAWTPRAEDSLGARIGKLTPESLASLWKSIEDRRLLDAAPIHETGNMTRSISITAREKRVQASWSYGPTVSDAVRPFAASYDECRRAVSQLKP